MKRQVTAMVTGILIIATFCLHPATAQAFRLAAQRPCKPLSYLADNTTQGKNAFVSCLLNRVSYWLKVTDEQKAAIKAILQEEIPNLQPLIRQLLENRQELEALTAEARFVESEVRVVAQKQGAVLVELIVIKERAKSEIYSVLTPEQRETLQELQAAIEDRLQDLFNR